MTARMERPLNRELLIALFREGHLLHRIIDAQRRNDEAWSACPIIFPIRDTLTDHIIHHLIVQDRKVFASGSWVTSP